MNVKKFQHPVTKVIYETKEIYTARILKAAGWVEVKQDAVIVTAGEGAKKS